MKILQLGKFYPIKGGVEKVMYDVLLGLSQRGISCDMMCAVTGRQKPGTIRLNGYARLLCVPALTKLKATMIAPAMIRQLYRRRKEYDVIHVHHPDPMAALALYLSGYKGNVALHWHSDIVKQNMLLRLYTPLQNWLIKRADVIVGTSPVYTERSPYLREVQHKTMCIPIGIEEPQRDLPAEEQVKVRYAGKRIVFSLGRLVDYKGYRFLIEAARLLPDDCVVLIGGDGPLKEVLQKQIDCYGLQSKVELLGFLSDEELPAYFGACDLFVLSSIQKTEAFAIVQVEAMAFGKPVVATRIENSGVSWVNAHGISGLNALPCSGKELADAMLMVLDNDELYKSLSAGARRRYEEMFTRRMMIDRCVQLYNSIVNGAVMR